jgi:formylglycine-generating enzyme required for sulfatase activity
MAFAFFLSVAPPASATTIDWTPIGNPGNACETQSDGCFGSVGYAYSIGTYEVTNAQYAEFLNAKAASDPLGLYHTGMGLVGYGGITRSGSSGSYSYSAIAGRGDMPVAFVSFYDALRFANWLNNGQGSGDTETGAYTLLGGTPTPSNGATVTRNAGATIFLTSEDEWYKAAYYNAITTSYFDYPVINAQTSCATPTASPNRANCDNKVANLTSRGSYPGSPSPNGTFDQGGNVQEWNESIVFGSNRVIRGGSWDTLPNFLAASARPNRTPDSEFNFIGFRVATIPEPGSGLLLMMGLLSWASWRRRHA